MTARQDEPESNHTSMVSVSLVEIGAAALALDAFRQNLSSGHIEPGVGTLLAEQVSNSLDGLAR